MISGRSILIAAALILASAPAWVPVLGPAWVPAARAADADWTLDRLGAAIANTGDGPVPFIEERAVDYLDEPLMLSGYVAREGARIEKHVLDPQKESVVFEGDSVTVRTAEGSVHTLDVDDHPMVQGLVAAFQATLQGRMEELAERFSVALEGGEADWRLTLTPKTAAMKEALSAVILSGRAGTIRTIRIETADGDSSVMTLLHDGA